MVDIIIVLIVVVLLGFALKGTFKHMKGESRAAVAAVEALSLTFLIKSWIIRYSEKRFSRFPVCTVNIVQRQ